MDAVKCIKEFNRMCKTYNRCSGCPLEGRCYLLWETSAAPETIEALVATIEKWSKENPLVTIECRRQAANAKMKKYKKKPIVIEAYQTDVTLDIETLEGIMHASAGDYIIIGVNGEQYPCKPDIFEKTYDEVSDECLPSAQPEQKKGEWINRSLNILYPEFERYTCSVCGKHSYSYDFCPNCGSYNGGEQDE